MERGCLTCQHRLPAPTPSFPCPGLPSVYIPIFHSVARSLFIHSFFVYVRKHSHPLCRYLSRCHRLCHSRRSCFRSAASNCSPHLPLTRQSASAALPAATAFPYNYLFRLLTLFLSPYSYSIYVASAAVVAVLLLSVSVPLLS